MHIQRKCDNLPFFSVFLETSIIPNDLFLLVRSCYQSSLYLLLTHGLRSIAFPCISTGAYRYPSVEAADIALSTVRDWLLDKSNLDSVDRVVFVTRTARDEEVYSLLLLVYFPLL